MSDRFAGVLGTDVESDALPVELVDLDALEQGTPWARGW